MILFQRADKIRKLVAERGMMKHVIFAGYQDDIPAILPIFDVFCLPSFSEGLPISVLEAMAAKIPVIGSRARGITEIIKHENTGLLFDIDNDEELERLLRELINDRQLLKKLGDSGYQHVVENHNSFSWINKYSEIFLGRQ